MSRAINDATPQKIGDVYQYFIALLDCFSLREDETLTIETTGDVSVISSAGSNRYQKEIKHHLGAKTLSNRDKDFWNTLDNWCIEFMTIKEFSKLILVTTASLPSRSIFSSWNSYTAQKKYDVLENCGSTIKEKEAEFRKHYNSIFGLTAKIQKSDLLYLLDKFEIYSSQTDISKICTLFAAHIGHIPLMNRDMYIKTLLGWILGRVTEAPHKWIVSKDDFDKMNQEATAMFAVNAEVHIPPRNTNELPTKSEFEVLSHKDFVLEIQRIKYDEVISQAIDDYWRAHTLIIQSYQNDMCFSCSIDGFKQDLSRRLSSEKRKARRNVKSQALNDRICASQDMYDSITGWPADRYDHIVGNQGYFQNGIIHEIVDCKEFYWYMEAEDEH